MRPRAGLCIPVRYLRCRDGDTIEVALPKSDYVWAIRLVDCWCPELRDKGGEEARAYAQSVLEDCEDLHLFVPLEPGANILKTLTTFDRLVGELWVSQTTTLNDMLVDAGHATRRKGESANG